MYTFILTASRIKEKLRSGEMAVSGDQWPIFLYQGYSYDTEDPWNGLFRSALLVSVSFNSECRMASQVQMMDIQAYKHIFTSPSSVDKEPKATRSSNAHIHGMTQVTPLLHRFDFCSRSYPVAMTAALGQIHA